MACDQNATPTNLFSPKDKGSQILWSQCPRMTWADVHLPKKKRRLTFAETYGKKLIHKQRAETNKILYCFAQRIKEQKVCSIQVSWRFWNFLIMVYYKKNQLLDLMQERESPLISGSAPSSGAKATQRVNVFQLSVLPSSWPRALSHTCLCLP